MPTGSGDIQTAVVVVAIVVNIPSAPLGLGCASPVSGLFFFFRLFPMLTRAMDGLVSAFLHRSVYVSSRGRAGTTATTVAVADCWQSE